MPQPTEDAERDNAAAKKTDFPSPAATTGNTSDNQRSRIWSRGFMGLVATQLLTATNDNVFRWLIIGIGKDYVAPEEAGVVLMQGTVCFVAPYLVLASLAGYFADRFRKRDVIVACKWAEVFIMAAGVAAIVLGQFWMLFAVVFLMGAQSALFSPAKLGCIPEILPASDISKANGLFGLTTVVSTVLGMGLGSWLSDVAGHRGTENIWLPSAVLLGLAVVGVFCSYLVGHRPAANPLRTIPWNAFTQTFRDMRTLAAERAMLRVALGIVFFWSIGALAQMNIDQFAMEGGAATESAKTPLLIALVLGVGIGSVLAGIWSGGRVELGILPLGAAVVSASAMLLFLVDGDIFTHASSWTTDFYFACLLLFFLGAGAGLFNVPLEAYMQHRSRKEVRGSILAASNFLTFSGVLVSALLFAALRTPFYEVAAGNAAGAGAGHLSPLLTSRQIFLLAGCLTIPVFLYILLVIPQASIRFFVWMLSRTFYRIRVYGRENLPEHGGALLTPNHVSWIDGILLLLTSSRPVHILAYAGNFRSPVMLWLANLWGAILITPGSRSVVKALKTARQALENGELVCIFPEGDITHTGQIEAFKPGMMRVLKGVDAPVIPVYLDGLWGSIFSFEGGRFFWKWPRRIPYPISIYFGKPLPHPDDPHRVRQAVQELSTQAVEQHIDRITPPPISFIRNCKRRPFTLKAADSMSGALSGGQLLMRTLILRRLLRREVLSPDDEYVGILLPPSAGGLMTNLALTLDRRIAVNLNYTASSEVLNACMEQCGAKRLLTSRKFMDKMNFNLDAEITYLEDLKQHLTLADKITTALQAYVLPSAVLVRSLRLDQIRGDDIMTLIFTSGSTGAPKGVMLTYANIGSNVEAIEQVIHLTPDDVLLGVLPFFHSFGYTITLWGAMKLDVKGIYHYSPLDARRIGKLCKQYHCTVMLCTPTFLRSYLKRCTKEDLQTVDVVVAGAEKLPKSLCDAFEEKFGVRPVEGYGTTELAPLVSVNVPESRSKDAEKADCCEGSVGRPIPYVSAKIVHPETGEELGVGEAGMLLISGPNVMRGYLGRDDLTAEVMRDGWYVTGDIALLDENGFIHITGRESRFSKIGGEMAPHILIEENLAELIGVDDEIGLQAVVTAVPDAKKGERLIVLHTAIEKTPQELCAGLAEAGLPNLFIPSPDSFLQVEELPMLGTGKLDLKAVKELALRHFAPQE